MQRSEMFFVKLNLSSIVLVIMMILQQFYTLLWGNNANSFLYNIQYFKCVLQYDKYFIINNKRSRVIRNLDNFDYYNFLSNATFWVFCRNTKFDYIQLKVIEENLLQEVCYM